MHNIKYSIIIKRNIIYIYLSEQYRHL